MMSDLFSWFLELGNSKVAALLIFFGTFIAILIYVYGSKSRGERLETYRHIPFLDDAKNESNESNNESSNVDYRQKKGEKG